MTEHGRNMFSAQLMAYGSVCAGTQKLYTNLWDKWCQYCSDNNVGNWAATPEDLIAYLQSIYQRNKSVSAAYQNLSAVSYFYRLKGLASPSVSPLVTMYMKGLKRHSLVVNPAVRQAKPMTREVLTKLNNFLLGGNRTLRQWRTIWRVNLAFFCLLRWDDVCRLEVQHFHVKHDNGMTYYEFSLVGGKTVMHEPNSTRRLYAHPGSIHCPVQMTTKYFAFLNGHLGSVVPQCSPGDRNVPHPGKALSYTNASEDLQYVLKLVGVDPRGFSEHSMKRGGATEAARCGASREEIQIAGHWACARTVEKYIDAAQTRQRNFHQYFL